MDKFELAKRTKSFAVNTIRFCRLLPSSTETDIIKRQLIRSSTSVGANYRAVTRSRSKAEFISKLSIVLEEVDESHYWLEILKELELGKSLQFFQLVDEADQLTRIFVSSRKTARNI